MFVSKLVANKSRTPQWKFISTHVTELGPRNKNKHTIYLLQKVYTAKEIRIKTTHRLALKHGHTKRVNKELPEIPRSTVEKIYRGKSIASNPFQRRNS